MVENLIPGRTLLLLLLMTSPIEKAFTKIDPARPSPLSLFRAPRHGVSPWYRQSPPAVRDAVAELSLQEKKKRWTHANKILAGLYTALTLVDWGQTLDFRRKGLKEANPILGAEPSEGRINTLVPLGLLGVHGISHYALKGPERNFVYALLGALEARAVIHNWGRGHRPALP